MGQYDEIIEMAGDSLRRLAEEKQAEQPKTTTVRGTTSRDGPGDVRRFVTEWKIPPEPFTLHRGLAGNPHIDPAYLSKLPKHKDWDRRFQCGAVWADKNGEEATVFSERVLSSPYVTPQVRLMRSGGTPERMSCASLDAFMDFLGICDPAEYERLTLARLSGVANIQGVGVSAEPPQPLACQDQYGDEDGL